MNTPRKFDFIGFRRACTYGLLLLLTALLGCDRDTFMKPFGRDRASLMKKLTPQHEESLALHCLELLRQHRFDQIEEQLDPALRKGDVHETLAGMAELFPNREPASVKTVDATVIRSQDSSTTSITLEYEFAAPTGTGGIHTDDLNAHSWLLGQVAIDEKESGAETTIAGIHVMPISKPIEILNAFTLMDKGSTQYAGLCLAILDSLFSVWVLVLCVRTKIGKAKAFWLIVILLGVCRLTINWTTGQFLFILWNVQLPPVTLFSSLYGPWMLNIDVPVGAIAFLVLRKRLARAVSQQHVNATIVS